MTLKEVNPLLASKAKKAVKNKKLFKKFIKEVFNFDVPDLSMYFCTEKKEFQKICQECKRMGSILGNKKR